MVGAEGFEPPASCSQSRRATRLRYAPNCSLLHDLSEYSNEKSQEFKSIPFYFYLTKIYKSLYGETITNPHDLKKSKQMLKNFKYFLLLFFLSTSLGHSSPELDETALSPRSLKLRRPPNALGLTVVLVASLVLSGENGSATEIPNSGTYKLCKATADIDAFKDFLLRPQSQDVVITKIGNEPKEITLEIYEWNTEKDENTNHFIFTICKVPDKKTGKRIK